MAEARFILSKKKVLEQYNKLKELGVEVAYSYKTNREVGDILQKLTDCYFSIHNSEEIGMIEDKNKIWFFTQAESEDELKIVLKNGVRNFVIDNKIDLYRLLNTIKNTKTKINLSLRMKFREHRIGTGKYFVYGMPTNLINKIIFEIKDNEFIDKIGVHIHRKSQNTSEWDMTSEIKDSLTKETFNRIDYINLGGGLPVRYKTYSSDILSYIFKKIKHTLDFLKTKNIKGIIEPGRFIAAPSIKLEAEIIQVYEKIIVLNCSIYNCAIDSVITNIRLLVEKEILENSKKEKFYLIKGNTPTRDDIFRYKVKLKNPQVGDKIVFLNAGAYNYSTDFCCLKKLKTEIIEDF